MDIEDTPAPVTSLTAESDPWVQSRRRYLLEAFFEPKFRKMFDNSLDWAPIPKATRCGNPKKDPSHSPINRLVV
jgi:hypothetical protein